MATDTPSDPPERTDDVCGAARAAGEPEPGGALDGPAGDGADASDPEAAGADVELEPPTEPDPGQAPPAVTELAAACVRFVATRYGAMLDFTPDTLSLVDQWLREARTELAARPEAAEVVQSAAGAYLGEVMRRCFGGEWFADGDPSGWRLYLSRVYCAYNPVGMAREALLLETAEGWHAHFELDPGERDAVEARLAALPPAEDDEFYAPTTRFDVLSIVFEALRESLRSRGLDDVRFTAQDYA